jgi:uncharacterized iron-regulated membrane protein
MSSTDALEQEQGRRATPYRAVWRWHFFAGLFSAPVLIILSITGALYLFDWEIDSWWHRDALRVEQGAASTTLAQQEAALHAAFPAAQIRSVALPRAPDKAARWIISTGVDTKREVFIDPHTAQITGSTDPGLNPMKIVRDLHSSILGGTAGRYLVELVACWTLVMLVTGLYLWWPRNWRPAAFIPRSAATGRAFWRDWHSIPAMFNALLVMFLVLTGMPWSVFWGVQIATLGEHLPLIAPSPNFTAAPPASVTGLPWTIQHHGTPTGTHANHVSIEVVEPALARFDTATHGAGLRVVYPAGPGDVFIAGFVPARAQGQRTLYLDAGTGKLLGDIQWKDYSPAAKAIEWGVMTHMGRQYGLGNQLAGLAVCLVIVGTSIAGVMMWWKRRPRGQLAAPQTKHGDRLPRFLVFTLCAMGLLFPLLGASLLLIAAFDRYAAARFSGLGRPTA